MCRIDDRVDPEASSGVARVGLMFVSSADRFIEFFLLFLVDSFAFALQLFQFDFNERPSRGITTHHSVAPCGPGKNKPGIVGLSAHGVVARTETASANHGNLRNDAVGN